MATDYTTLTDEELVKQTLEKPDAYLFLMRRYETPLLRYIQRILVVNEADAEDILQESFIKIYQHLNDFDLKLKFSSWVYRIVHNQAISFYRKHKNQAHIATDDTEVWQFEQVASTEDLVEDLDNKIRQDQIKQVLEKLDEKYREVLVLKFIEDKDYQEISDILQKPIGTIGTLVHRAKKQFKQIIDSNQALLK